ncbi:MAG: ABC transporter permease [Candidatus Hydrogenedentes bacterium]|nr:ABC transporter permease [Candidatus Hydrogenedentota bacterium]
MTTKRVPCPKELNQESGRGLLDSVRQQGIARGEELILDFSETETMDSRGGAWLLKIADLVRSKHGEFRFESHHGRVAEFMELIKPGLEGGLEEKPRSPGFVERVGDHGINFVSEARDFLDLYVDAIYWTFVGPFEGRKFRWGLFVDEVHEMGVRAIGINCLMNFLLGMIIAMLSAAQLRLYGADIYVASLVVIAFFRELAAVMTAVVVSARTGAAIAAELATMEVQEEIDALRGMGLNVAQFLVAPKVLALLLAMPCLVVLGMVSGILGGAAWGIPVLGHRSDVWFRQTLDWADLGDFFQGMLKSVIFAFTIVLVGCHNGLRVKGGSRGVGLMTTRAVVMDIFFLIVIDMIFAAIFYYAWD